MADIFNTVPNRQWTFTATPASILYCTNLPLPLPKQPYNNPVPNSEYWARVTQGIDFTDADRIDGAVFNRILWKGIMGRSPILPLRLALIYARTATNCWPTSGSHSRRKRS
jgi:hypothetical protein